MPENKKKFKRVGGGNMFKNNYKENENQPDMRGDIEIEGVKYEIAGWKKLTQAGDPMLSVSVSVVEETEEVKVEKETQDDLPF